MTDTATAEAPATAKATKKETQVESVKMDDGRVVDFAGKRKMLKEGGITPEGKLVLRIDFRNGETRLYPLHPELINKFALHGAEQKYGDETAGLEDVDDMVLACDELHDRLYPAAEGAKPEWSTKREGSGLGGTSVLAQALAKVKNVPIERVREWLKTKTPAEKVALRTKNPEVKAAVEAIEAEKASKGSPVDTGALLAELN